MNQEEIDTLSGHIWRRTRRQIWTHGPR